MTSKFKEFISNPDRVFNAISIFLGGTAFGIFLAVYVGVWK